jgi:transcription termination factor NusA
MLRQEKDFNLVQFTITLLDDPTVVVPYALCRSCANRVPVNEGRQLEHRAYESEALSDVGPTCGLCFGTLWRSGRAEEIATTFMKVLAVTDSVAAALVDSGFTRLEEIAYVPTEELAKVLIVEDADLRRIRERARVFLVKQAIAKP